MLTFRSLAAGAPSEASAYTAHLLEKTLPDDEMQLAEYYAGTTGLDPALADGMGAVPQVRDDLDAGVAAALGVKPGEALSERQLAMLISGRRADGSELDGKQRGVGRYAAKAEGAQDRFTISGMDICLSAPKSVSVAWAFAKTAAERNTILQAHRDARDATLRYIEQEIGFATVGKGGSKGLERARLGWVTIDHFTSRPTITLKRPDPETGVIGTEVYTINPRVAGDPQLHSHNIVPNVVVTESGRVASVPSRLIAGRVHEFGATYQAFLAANLRAADIQVELCPSTHMATLPVIPGTVCDEFSKRTRDAHAAARTAAAERGLDWDGMDGAARIKFVKGGAKASRKFKSDDLSNFKAWFDQAEALGWKHDTAVTDEAPRPALPVEESLAAAFETALPLLEDELNRNTVVEGTTARLQAARGLIAHGIASADDIGAVTRIMAREGVVQDGRPTRLLWSGDGARGRITTELHRDQEAELIRLARKATRDRSRALAVEEMTFPEFASAEQRAASIAIGTGGAFGVFIGAAGTGKTSAALPPLVEAYKARGFQVWGVAQAWRQATGLAEAGIPGFNTRALQPFLQGVASGATKVDARSVVIIDELSQIGTAQLLKLLRLRDRHGFIIIATGDDKQCRSVEAGAVIDLLRQALGESAIPQILTTVRQQTEREREIAGLFREGKPVAAARALDMKLEDGTALAVEGGFDDAVARVADLAVDHDASVSAPTNADALAIGRAIRARLQASGRVGKDRSTVQATDGRGGAYVLALAPGDKVRLFARTSALFNGRSAQLGHNGSILDVVDVTPNGLTLRTANGKIGLVAWETLRDPLTRRVRLGLGYCLTIDTAQGMTSDRHILALPRGSAGVSAQKAYVGASRHRITSWIVTSKGAELQQIDVRRPLGIKHDVTDRDVWNNIAKNLSQVSLRMTATEFLKKASAERRKSVQNFQGTKRTIERRKLEGKPETELKERALGCYTAAVAKSITKLHNAMATFKRPLVSEIEARDQFAQAIRAVGLELDGALPEMDGRRHYVRLADAPPAKKQGLYQGYLDGWPAGFIKNYKTGEERKWKAEAEHIAITAAEAAQLARKAREKVDQRRAQKLSDDARTAMKARGMLDLAGPALRSHPYLRRKGIQPDALLQDRAGRLIVPMFDVTGKIWNLQLIAGSGFKWYLPGRKQGLCHMLGQAVDGEPLGIAEGLATASTVREATGLPVAVAFDASNLLPVAQALRGLYPASPILIMGDDDRHLPARGLPNVGREKAEEAARAVGGRVVFPVFEDGDMTSTDFNDIGGRGLEAVTDRQPMPDRNLHPAAHPG